MAKKRLSDGSIDRLAEMLRWYETTQKGRNMQGGAKPVTPAIETYLGRTGMGGLPAQSDGTAGSGEVIIQTVNKDDGTINNANYTVTAYNVTDFELDPFTPVTLSRDPYSGAYIANVGGGGEECDMEDEEEEDTIVVLYRHYCDGDSFVTEARDLTFRCLKFLSLGDPYDPDAEEVEE